MEFVAPGGSHAPAGDPLGCRVTTGPEAPARPQELTESPSRGPQWESPPESLERTEGEESAEAGSEAWTPPHRS